MTEKIISAIFENALVRFIVIIFLSTLFYILISSHYTMQTQFVIGYGSALFLFILLQFKTIPDFLRLFVKLLAVIVVLRYLYWRTFDSLIYEGFFDYIGALFLYGAELIAIVIYLLGIFTSLHILKRKPIELSNYSEDELPTVDVLIPTYNEPNLMIENTVLAALAFDYPKDKFKVFLCDDGGTDEKCNDSNEENAKIAKERREHLQKFCEYVGATYVTREKNISAKAGNLNSALKYAKNDLILILDTDHIPAKQFLQRTTGWFLKDEKMFLVQTPHAFYNADPIERNLKMFGTSISENDMFYRYIQLGHDFWESSFFCGSAALLRRKYIDELGGIAGETITEDAETAIKLHNKGYKSAYISEPLIRGLHAENFAALVLQRIRWTQGMVQIFMLKNPFLSKNLKWHQKLSYLSASFFWFFAFSRVVFYLAPLMYLFFDLRVYNANGTEMLAYVVPHMLMAVMMSFFLYAKVRNPFFSELYETVLSFFTLPAIIQTLWSPRKPTFKVTPKGEDQTKTHVSEFAIPFVIMLTIVTLGFIASALKWYYYPQERDIVLMTTMWNLLNFFLLISAIAVTSEKGDIRKYIRVPINAKCKFIIDNQAYNGTISDIGEGGMSITPVDKEGKEALLLEHKDVIIELPDVDNQPFKIPAQFLRAFGWGSNLIFIFKDISKLIEPRQKLIQIVYGNTTVWREFDESHKVMNPFESFAYIVKQSFKNALFREAFTLTFFYMKNILSTKKGY